MSVLALDLGTTTGWAWRQREERIRSGVWVFKPRGRFEGGGMRYLRFREQLTRFHVAQPVKEVYFEEVRRHLGVDAAHAYGGFLAHLSAWCEEHEIAYEGVGVGQIKKFWTGKGNAQKDAMIAEAVRRGHAPKDDNEADAIALLTMKTELTP